VVSVAIHAIWNKMPEEAMGSLLRLILVEKENIMAKICSIPGCGKIAHARGWCEMHYTRWRRHGEPETTVFRPYGMSRAETVRWFSERATLKGECLLANVQINNKGYPLVHMDGRMELLHRLALMEKLGRDLLPGECALHACDTPRCIEPTHLFAGTLQDNNADRDAKNRQAKGSELPQSKLTEADIPHIRHLLRQGRTLKSVADIYGVAQTTICDIHTGKNWSHVP